ncbi:hypothetical protein CLOM_g23900, partial [Closterium sp. NIES-68]
LLPLFKSDPASHSFPCHQPETIPPSHHPNFSRHAPCLIPDVCLSAVRSPPCALRRAPLRHATARLPLTARSSRQTPLGFPLTRTKPLPTTPP